MVPEIFVDIWDSFQSGNFKQARESQEKGAQVGALVENTKMHAYYKAFISKRIGIDCGQPRPPFEGLTSSEKDDSNEDQGSILILQLRKSCIENEII